MSIKETLKEVWSNTLATIGVGGAAFSVYAYFVGVEAQISAYWLFILCFTFILVIIWMAPAIRYLYRTTPTPPPRVISLRQAGGKRELVLKGSQGFNVNSLASIFEIQDLYEVLIGVGVVTNVQQNEIMSIEVHKVIESTEPAWEALMQNPSTAGSRIIVKAAVNLAHLEADYRGDENA